MHKLTLAPRKVVGVVEGKVETLESTSGDEDFIFLVAPRAASFSVDRAPDSRTVFQRIAADR